MTKHLPGRLRPEIRVPADLLRDGLLRLEALVDRLLGRTACSRFQSFLETAGSIRDPDSDYRMAAFWVVFEKIRVSRTPEPLETARRRYLERCRRDPDVAAARVSCQAQWAEIPPRGCRVRPAEGVIRAPRARGRSERRLSLAAPVMAALLFVLSFGVSGGGVGGLSVGDLAWIELGDISRGPFSLVTEAVRAEYVRGLGMLHRSGAPGAELAALERARRTLAEMIEVHSRIERVTARTYLVHGRISLLAGYDREARKALARAATIGGAAGQDAARLLERLERDQA